MSSYDHFKKAVDIYGNNEVARRLKKSKTTVSLVYRGRYPNPQRIYALAAETFAADKNGFTTCPVLGEISAAVCARFYALSRAGKVHRDPNYRRVKDACRNCKMRSEQ